MIFKNLGIYLYIQSSTPTKKKNKQITSKVKEWRRRLWVTHSLGNGHVEKEEYYYVTKNLFKKKEKYIKIRHLTDEQQTNNTWKSK